MRHSKISSAFLSKALDAYQKYKGDKELLNQRVRENDYWYKARYGAVINPKSNETEPVTAFIFSAIENKFADAVDNYPMPNVLEREPSDRAVADILSKVVPVQLDMADFKKAYKTNWRRKLKHGTGIYGIFYKNQQIKICPLSILNVYCDMHVEDVQDSQFLFIVNAVDNDELCTIYPHHSEKFTGNATVEAFDGSHEIEDKTEIIDCYYKKHGRVHCMKLCRNEIIAATEEGDYPNGIYSHGMYPVVFDVMYPEEDCPFGFGVIDVAKNPQAYIDKLDSAIIKNAVLSSKIRFLIKDSGAVNEEEVLNCDNDIIHVAGSVDTDSIRELQTSNMPAYVIEHRSLKINELKEVVGNRDFQQGGTSGGVTAASAISALQETGNKLARSAIDDSYDSYKQVVIMVIELMREFFEEKRIFRITGSGDEHRYAEFSSSMLYKQQGDKAEPIIFDVDIVPQKQNPFQRESNNSTIIQLWQAGFFNPQMSSMAVVALEAMNFDGKDTIIKQLKSMGAVAEQKKRAEANGFVPINEYLQNRRTGVPLKSAPTQTNQLRKEKL